MSAVEAYLPYLANGLLVTLQVTALAVLLAVPLAVVAGLGRMSAAWPVRWATGAYIEAFRGTSVIIQLFWFFYVFPFFGVQLAPIVTGCLVLGLNGGAYGAEIVRGAIQSLPKGQTEAAIALGMSKAQRLRRVILPQAIPAMIPPFGNLSIDLLKATSVVSLVTVSDLAFRAQVVRASTGETTAVFGTILVSYFAVAVLMSLAWRWLEGRVRVDRPAKRRRSDPPSGSWSGEKGIAKV